MVVTTSKNRPTRDQAERAVRTLIEFVGENPDREGLQDTPKRVVNYYNELFSGYLYNPDEILSHTFQEVDGYDEIVLLRNVRFKSFCEHHMLPIIGIAHLGYFPSERVVGISKLARVVDVYAKRMQIQERLTAQIAQAIDNVLAPKGVAVIIESEHYCMSTRDLHKPEVSMTTTRMLGCFKDNYECRREFYQLVAKSE
ncbi:GTP cyclohydrolase I [Candidatus Endolissoclinum faulkneri L2]|uniref:GTP cyclohydrolase 1 n=1 Tax=Candidatus Endolissoclinum faulkneri L2 TaxID=1193729 RepID=K7ZCQ4_9PROT|nr:GTP cyclohydrolase I FolE [Candidatus Endolissoclinum faulkneri]AFX98806.1 GTP cyclohydrolase I [Candidatus Endolissoclinum faulkneri L2]